MNYFIFLSVFLLMAVVFTGYMGLRLIPSARLRRPWNIAAWAFLSMALLSAPIPIILRRIGYENYWVDLYSSFVYMHLGFTALLLTLLIIRDLGWFSLTSMQKIVSRMNNLFRPGNKSKTKINIGRRRFLFNSMNAGIVTAVAPLTAYGTFEAQRVPDVKKVNIFIKDLMPDLDGLRIAQITDLHIRETGQYAWLKKVVEKVNGLSPHIIALTGDLVDSSAARLKNTVSPLAGLSAQYGHYFVTGNHEYYWNVEEWLTATKQLGFKNLLNEHVLIHHNRGRLLLGGITDYRAGRFLNNHRPSAEKAFSGAPDSDFKILLAHQPKSVEDAARAGFDLQISGHTHGGQFFPWNLAVNLAQPFVSGLHTFKNTRIYVSRGTGYWGPPVRLFAPSEITLLRLRAV